MRWRQAAITGGTSLAAAATLNAIASHGVGPLENPLGGEEGTFTWRGQRVAFTRRGEGRPLLLVHGIHAGASSFEWREVVDALAATHEVWTLDLIGFGRSDRPALKYTAALQQSLVAEFTARQVGQPTVLVASGVSAAYAVNLAARDAERWPAIVLCGPVGVVPKRASASFTADALRVLVGSPILGTTMYNALVTRAALRELLESLVADRALVTPELVGWYYASSHQPGAKHALAAHLAGQLEADLRHALRRLQQPALAVWGRQARQSPVEQARSLRVLKPDIRLELLDRCGDLPHLERPDSFVAATLDFLAARRTPRVLPMRGRRVG